MTDGGLNPSGIGGERSRRSDFKSVSAEDAQSGKYTVDRSADYPQFPTSPRASGPPKYVPYHGADNPVLTVNDVTDVDPTPDLVADPFAVVDETDQYHMFFEVLRDGSPNESWFGHATSPDGVSWTYNQTVLGPSRSVDGYDPGGVYNYPYVLKHKGEWYMLDHGGPVRMFRATDFPTQWQQIEAPMSGLSGGGEIYSDPTPIYWNDKWFMLTFEGNNTSDSGVREKHVWYADSLVGGDWTAHPDNPVVVSDPYGSNAGRPILTENYIDLPTRESIVNGIRITEMTETTFEWEPLPTSPLVEVPQYGWNSKSVHHLDPLPGDFNGKGIAIVDGGGPPNNRFSIGVYARQEQEDRRVRDNYFLRTKAARHQIEYEDLNAYREDASTNASATRTRNSLELSVPATSGEFISITKELHPLARLNKGGWAQPWEFRCAIEPQDNVSARADYYGVGRPQFGNHGIAFKLDSGSWYGAVNDGSSETTTQALSQSNSQIDAPSTGSGQELFFDFRPDDGRVDFYVDGYYGDSITSGLPTGGSNSIYTAVVHSETTADSALTTQIGIPVLTLSGP